MLITFTDDLAKGIKHLISSNAPYGTYNLTGDGEPASWADMAKNVYELAGKNPDDVIPVSTEEYYAGKEFISPRPANSTLSLDKIKSTGFTPTDWRQSLINYIKREDEK